MLKNKRRINKENLINMATNMAIVMTLLENTFLLFPLQ